MKEAEYPCLLPKHLYHVNIAAGGSDFVYDLTIGRKHVIILALYNYSWLRNTREKKFAGEKLSQNFAILWGSYPRHI